MSKKLKIVLALAAGVVILSLGTGAVVMAASNTTTPSTTTTTATTTTLTIFFTSLIEIVYHFIAERTAVIHRQENLFRPRRL